jgi:sorting nexin-5/6/32
LQLGDSELPQDEMAKLKGEIQSEYLSAFQKAVAMHEVFLIRLSHHAALKKDTNLQLFLEYDKMMSMESKSAGDKLSGMFGSMMKSVTGDGLATHVDPDETFGKQKDFILNYQTTIEACAKACAAKISARQALVSHLGTFSIGITHLGNVQTNYHTMSEVIRKLGSANQIYTTIGKKLVAKEDIKMADLLTYYHADVSAARDLMARRLGAIKDNLKRAEALNKAKLKGVKVIEAQDFATIAKDTFEKINKEASVELQVFQKRRGAAFRKGLIHYAQSQIRQSRESYSLWKQTLAGLEDITK